MTDEMQEFSDGLSEVREDLQQFDPGSEGIHRISETVRYLDEFKSVNYLSESDKRALETWFKRCVHVVDRWFGIDEAIGFQYYSRDLNDNYHRATTHFMALITALDAIHRGEGMKIGSSEWRETMNALDEMYDDISRIFRSQKDHEILSWFIVLNAIEALQLMEDKGNTSGRLSDFCGLIENFSDSFEKCKGISTGLQNYAYDLSERGLIDKSVLGSEPPDDERSKIFHILGKLRRSEKVETSTLPSSTPSTKPHLWTIARAWIRAKNGDPTGIIPYGNGINTSKV